jgi:hypothetical protein
MVSDDKPKRLETGLCKPVVMSPERRETRHEMTVAVIVPTIHHLLSDGLSILHREMSKLVTASGTKEGLNKDQSQKLARYISALTRLADEERAQRLSGVDGEATDEELLEELAKNDDMARKLFALLQERFDGGTKPDPFT